MVSPYYFIVSPLNDKRYDNVITFGNNKLVTSSSIEDHKAVNRFAKVIEVPMYYNGPISKGDILVVHHNVFRIYYGMQGEERSSWSKYKDNIYLIDQEQFYLYKKNEADDWESPFPYCFISPIDKEKKAFLTLGVDEELWGKVEYIPESVDSKIKKGDLISFQPEMEYEFFIDKRRLFRMNIRNLCLKI
jgi:hypothetical protein